MNRTALTLLLTGCLPGSPSRERPLPSEDVVTDTTPDDTGPAPTIAGVRVVQGGEVRCADPAQRANLGEFRLEELPDLALPAQDPVGTGLAGADLDDDGQLDLIVPGDLQGVRVWWGGTPGWEVGDEPPGEDLDAVAGVSPADADGDGDLDLLLARYGRPAALLRNEGGRAFTDVTRASGLHRKGYKSQSASWADIDADGDLDLFSGSYGVQFGQIDDCDGMRPDPSELYRNRGDGTFEDIHLWLPVAVQRGYVFASGFYDVDLDGFPELFTAHDAGTCAGSVLSWNAGGAGFVVDVESGFHPGTHDMGMAVGDLNGDLLPDFAFTSFESLHLVESHRFEGGLLGVRWVDTAAARGVRALPRTFGWGTELADLDNDGDLDLIAIHGYWTAWPNVDQALEQPDLLLVQDDAGQLIDQAGFWRSTDAFGVTRDLADPGAGRAVLAVDLDHDGWLDLVERGQAGSLQVHRARCGAASWLSVSLRQPGPNTRAVGARVVVEARGVTRVRWITAGSSGQYTGQPAVAHFGLGDADVVDHLEVRWPDGATTALDGLRSRQEITLVRP